MNFNSIPSGSPFFSQQNTLHGKIDEPHLSLILDVEELDRVVLSDEIDERFDNLHLSDVSSEDQDTDAYSTVKEVSSLFSEQILPSISGKCEGLFQWQNGSENETLKTGVDEVKFILGDLEFALPHEDVYCSMEKANNTFSFKVDILQGLESIEKIIKKTVVFKDLSAIHLEITKKKESLPKDKYIKLEKLLFFQVDKVLYIEKIEREIKETKSLATIYKNKQLLDAEILNSPNSWFRKELENQKKILSDCEQRLLCHTTMEEIFKELGHITNLNKYEYSTIDQLGRFIDVQCLEETRFRGNPENPKSYSLHANRVFFETKPNDDRDFNGKLILSQYPMLHQFNAFWRALKYAPIVVDLTNSNDKVDPYYSYDLDRKVQLKNVVVTCCYKKSIGEGLEEFTYIVDDRKYHYSYLVHRLHFEKWTDRDVLSPKDLTMLMEKCYDHEKLNPNTKNHFCGAVIHCMAGVGRSGTFAVAYALYDMIQKKLIDKSMEEGRLKQILCELVLSVRLQRGPQCIQTAGQLKTIWNWLKDILERDISTLNKF